MVEQAPSRDTGFLPWQLDTARDWLGKRERMAHAWLIHGTAGTGKRRFAQACAASLLCETPQDGFACGRCDACLWIRHGNHPDLRALRPEAVALAEDGALDVDSETTGGGARSKTPSRDIRVEQVRALESWLNTATHRGGARVVLLYPAEALNAVSANALLKILEEPPAHTIFLLVADAPDRLLPTLVSRCRRLPLGMPSRDAALAWLQAAGVRNAEACLAATGGAPLAAAELDKTGTQACPAWLERWLQAVAAGRAGAVVASVAADLERQPPDAWLDVFQRALVDIACVQAGGAPRYYPGLTPVVQAVAARTSRVETAQVARWLAGQQRISRHPLNPGLFTQAVLLRLSGLAGA